MYQKFKFHKLEKNLTHLRFENVIVLVESKPDLHRSFTSNKGFWIEIPCVLCCNMFRVTYLPLPSVLPSRKRPRVSNSPPPTPTLLDGS